MQDAVQTSSAARQSSTSLARVLAAIGSVLRSVKIRRREHSLRICETLQLGEKRFLAVVQFEQRRFLIGATNQSISLLDRLDPVCTTPQERDTAPDVSASGGAH